MARTMTGGVFLLAHEAVIEPTEPGITRQVLAHGPALMLVRVAFEAGAIGPEHRHPHVQNSYVESGRFAITIAGETRHLGRGDSFHVPGDVPHGAKALEAGSLIDAFTPRREEFIRPA